ncbi:hypothetical protein PybrP1_007960 [[Pythium] brassicae (nom. inval.)]|nr:hypothetical protein PybrP1_007960 [[Pythium] brassicae (nom. inval.)]
MDSKLPSVFPKRFYLDLVDDDWIADTLSDDEIDVPPGADLDPDSSDHPSGSSGSSSAAVVVALRSNQAEADDDEEARRRRQDASFAKQEQLVAAATAKAFASRFVSFNMGGGASSGSAGADAAAVIDGINPYVEQQHSGDEAEEEEDDDEEEEDDDERAAALSTAAGDDSDANLQSLEEWENPSYLVKNLDTGESYNVEEIEQHYTLVTLDAVAAQHGSTTDGGAETSTSAYLLQLYTSDETADIEIEESPADDDLTARLRTANLSMDAATEPVDPVPCRFAGCSVIHHRPSGFCLDHEMVVKEDEDSRAQALYLIPSGARAEFVQISGHGFVYDAASRLYTVYACELRCAQSGASWVIYRRYQEFKALNDALRPLGVRVPILPPKKLFGAFEPEFLRKRQHELGAWLRALLNFDRVDQSARNPHLLEPVRKFLTSKADQPPFLLDRLPLKKSRFFGASLAGDDDDDDSDSDGDSNGARRPRVTLQDFQMIQVIGRGSFGKVVLVGHRATKKLYAMKILSKENIVKRKQVEHTRTERRKLFERLRSARLHFPPYVSRRAEALIRQLLNRNPAERLGAKGAHHVKSHLFFESVDWGRLLRKQVAPPFRPCHTAMNDGEAPLNFEAEFTRLPLPSAEVLGDASGFGASGGGGAGATSATASGTGVAGRLLRADSDTFQGFTFENTSLLEAVATEEAAV